MTHLWKTNFINCYLQCK